MKIQNDNISKKENYGDTDQIIKNIRYLLEKKQMKNSDLARALHISSSVMSKMLNGTRALTVSDLILIADIFDVSLDALVKKSFKEESSEIYAQLNDEKKKASYALNQAIRDFLLQFCPSLSRIKINRTADLIVETAKKVLEIIF